MLLSMEEFRAFRPKKPTYALFGWPLGHTMSPELHAQLFGASGQDAAYIGVAVPPDDLAEAFDLAKEKLAGINCTIPHKKAVIELLDGVDTAARDLHSVNTVAFRDGKAIGYNTDILGFSESLVRDGVTLRGKKVLLLGYGGAASVMAYHCAREGAHLTITGRNLEKAAALQQQIAVAGAGVGGGVSVAQVKPGQLQALAQFLRERLRVQYDKSPRHAVCTHQRDEFRRCLFQKRVVLGGVRRQLSRRDGAVLHKALVQLAQYLLRQAEAGPAAHHIVFQIARPALYALVQHRVCIFVHAFQQA